MQPTSFPGSQATTCRYRAEHESSEPLGGRLGARKRAHSEGISYKPLCGEIGMCRRVGRMGSDKR